MKHGGYENKGNDQYLYSQSISQFVVSAQRVLPKHHTHPRIGQQPIAGSPPAVCHRYPIIHLGEERQNGASFLSKKTI